MNRTRKMFRNEARTFDKTERKKERALVEANGRDKQIIVELQASAFARMAKIEEIKSGSRIEPCNGGTRRQRIRQKEV